MGRPNLNKVPVKITVNKEILEAAREVIPNLSHFVETKLLEFLYSINHPIAKDFQWARPDSNRGPSPRQGDVITARPRARCHNLAFRFMKFVV